MTDIERQNWVCKAPAEVLVHGPSKIYIDRYLWFRPEEGIFSSYKVQPKDVADHFDVFRGVDIIESAGQTAVSACAMMESAKQGKSIDELKKHFRMAFLGMGEARFSGFVKVHEVLVSICTIKHYKFRQMVVSCKVYKVATDGEVAALLEGFKTDTMQDLHIPESFELVAELNDMIGRAVPIEKIYTN
jgi:3-hydroxymyristoyl/3-hydroxydecanoyl-(acyl carrier protein) dehydratase